MNKAFQKVCMYSSEIDAFMFYELNMYQETIFGIKTLRMLF